MSVVSRSEQGSESGDDNNVRPGVGQFVSAPNPVVLPSLSGTVQTEPHYPQNGEWCQNCELLKQDIRGLRTDHALNYKALKEKIINTDMLIKKYNDKCQQYDTQSKKLDELNTNIEKLQRDRDAVQCQLQATLADLEPLRRTVAKAEKEKTKNITVIRDLQDKINAFQATALQHIQLLQHHEQEMATVTQQQKQSQQTMRELQAAKKKQDTTLKKMQDEVETKKTELTQAKKKCASVQQTNQKLQDLILYYEEVLADWDLQHLMKKKRFSGRRSLANISAASGTKEDSSTEDDSTGRSPAEDSVELKLEHQTEALLKPSLNILQPALHDSQNSLHDSQHSVRDHQQSLGDQQHSIRDPHQSVQDLQRAVPDPHNSAVRDPQLSVCNQQHSAARGQNTDSLLEYDLEMIFVDLGVERRRGDSGDSHCMFRPISPALSPLPASPAPPPLSSSDAGDEEDMADVLGDGQQQSPNPTMLRSCARSKSRRKTPKRRNSIRTQLLKTVVSNAKGRDTSADEAVKQKRANIQERLLEKSTIPFQSFQRKKSVCKSIECERTESLNIDHRQSGAVKNVEISSSDSDTEDKSSMSPKVYPRLSLRRSPRLNKSGIDKDIQSSSPNSDDGFLKPLLPAARRQERSHSLPASLTQTGLQNKEQKSPQNQNSEHTKLEVSEKSVKPAASCKTRSLSRQLSLHETNDVEEDSCDFKSSCEHETTDLLETLPSATAAAPPASPSQKPNQKQLIKQGTQSFEVGMNSLPKTAENDEESTIGSKAVFYIPESDHSTSESDRDETMSHSPSETGKTSEVSTETAVDTSDKDKSNQTAVETSDRVKIIQTTVATSDRDKNNLTAMETSDKDKNNQTAVKTSDKDKNNETAMESSEKDKCNQMALETSDRDRTNQTAVVISDRDKNNQTAMETSDREKSNQTAVKTSDKDNSNQTAMETSDNNQTTGETSDRGKNNQTSMETSDRDKSHQTAMETLNRDKNNQTTGETSDRGKNNQTSKETSDRNKSHQTALTTSENKKSNELLMDRHENSEVFVKTTSVSESTGQSCSSELLHNVDIASDYTGNPLSPLPSVDALVKPLSPLPPTPPRSVILIPGPAGSVTLRPRPKAAEDRCGVSATVHTTPAVRRKRRSQDSGLDVTQVKKLSAADDIIRPHSDQSTELFTRGQHTLDPLEFQLNCLLKETSISVETVADRLLAIQPAVSSGTLATAIVPILLASQSCQLEVSYDKYREESVSQNIPQHCTLTAPESRLLCCLQLLQKQHHLTTVMETVLQVATSTLLSAGQKTSLPTSLIRVFTALCRQHGDVERVRVLCYDAVYQGLSNYPLVLLTVATVWPLTLYDQTPTVKNPVLQVLQYTFINKPSQGNQAMHDEVIKGMHYLCSWSESAMTSIQLLTSLLQELQRESLDISPKHSVLHQLGKSIELLSKVEGWSWTLTTVIRGRLWPLLDHWLGKKTTAAAAVARPETGHILVSNILHIVCGLLWQCQPEDYGSMADVTTETFTILRDLLVSKDLSVEVQTSAIETLLPLAVFQPEKIATFCCQWMDQHKHGKKNISGETLDKLQQMLRYYKPKLPCLSYFD